MQGQAQVVDYLKTLLKGELAARDQYFLHSRMYADWGFNKLYERINHEMEEETQHADVLLQRILFLQGTPDMTPEPINPGTDVPSMLRSDLALEYNARAALAQAIELCEHAGDYVTRAPPVAQLHDPAADHAYWLEQQLRLIDRIGLQNYLQSQMS